MLADTRLRVRGVFAMLAFRPGWRGCFDITPVGVGRSFNGVLLALPAFYMIVVGANMLVADNPALYSPDARTGFGEAALAWLRIWALFPLAAWLTVRVMGLSERLGAWVAVHNWAVFVLLHIQALIWTLYLAGLANAAALQALMGLYGLARYYVHWRVAHGALGLPPVMAGAAAAIPLVIEAIVLAALAYG
ncbi:hypothetical protein F1654_02790 [Alkalicaulis satelles]|uniref:Uncharacterized protein n=1 Tax=Alkalicaulis satelles TaxID=2609175 RepID=A0A5M6ZJH8_9PROT|nr:hypothetical protein [Alkalicaulis satelles]KAA5804939.1 hypothetical protein F1654_02790 [Alkalicaulis satelles]